MAGLLLLSGMGVTATLASQGSGLRSTPADHRTDARHWHGVDVTLLARSGLTRTIPGPHPAGCLRQSKTALLPFCRTVSKPEPPITE